MNSPLPFFGFHYFGNAFHKNCNQAVLVEIFVNLHREAYTRFAAANRSTYASQ